jgi:hypothetical protein
MDMPPETLAPAVPDLSPAAVATLPPERVFSEPGRLSAAVLTMLAFAEGDAATLATCAGIYESSSLALIAGQTARRLARIRRELETVLGEPAAAGRVA